MTMATAALCTAEEFLDFADLEGSVELVKGQVNRMPPAFPRHAQVCAKLARLLGNFAEEKHGHVLSNDVCLITQRNPDTVRGADVAYVSYAKVPKGPLPAGYLSTPPDIVFEVRSPSDRWKELMKKVLEYLEAGTLVVCVVDPTTETAWVYRSDRDEEQFSNGDTLRIEDVLPGFSVPLQQLFE
jgi:Uma2 family endonuclease